jgi:DNA-directed RNA polymerase specialized sigma subunit
MATITRTRTTRRSSRRSPATPPDLSRLGSFPPPTATSEQLAVDNLKLASDRARKFAAATKMQGIQADLEAVAWTGLLNACRRYDPGRLNPATGRPYSISTAAVPFIDGAMRRYLRDKGHAIKFPNEWREKAPRARREVLSNKKTIEEAAALVGMDPLDVGEMLHCMGPTGEIQDEQFQVGGREPDLPDEEGAAEFAAELELARKALDMLGDDSGLMIEWWHTSRRRACPSGPLQQFQRRARRLRAKEAPQESYRQGLLLSPEVMFARVEALGLLPEN